MKIKIFFIVFHCISLVPLKAQKNEPVNESLIHEIITECVSKTGGFIIQDKIKDDNDREFQIALPEEIDHYGIVKILKPLMVEVEYYYHSAKPWKVLENGYLCNFNLAKDGSNRSLSFIFLPDEHILYISDSPTNSPNLYLPTSYINKLEDWIIWGCLNSLDGFIREETEENLSEKVYLYQVAIQLQENASPTSLISDLKPITTTLEKNYYLSEPWKRDEKGILGCEYFVKLPKENRNLFINFYFFPKPNVLVIDFITSPIV